MRLYFLRERDVVKGGGKYALGVLLVGMNLSTHEMEYLMSISLLVVYFNCESITRYPF